MVPQGTLAQLVLSCFVLVQILVLILVLQHLALLTKYQQLYTNVLDILLFCAS
jgi:hypothetical protein